MSSSPQTDPQPAPTTGEEEAAAFIAKWADKDGGERANYQLFIGELCDLLGAPAPDPAGGTGNFLYVTLEHLKRLEGEVLDTLERFGGNRSLEMDTATVRPNQMRGIEINPRAAVIAELVLWIGYLQWHLRTAGDVKTVSEPILEDAQNIETRDAILTYDAKQIVRDESGRPKTHWDGRTTKPHSVVPPAKAPKSIPNNKSASLSLPTPIQLHPSSLFSPCFISEDALNLRLNSCSPFHHAYRDTTRHPAARRRVA